MTDTKMSELLDLPVDCHDIESKIMILRSSDLQVLSDKINAYDANQERIKELEAQQQWINVAYKKPTQNYCVDIWVNSQDITGRVCNCFYNPKNNKFWYWDNKCKTKIQIYASYVTHWMPLPKPPEE